MVPQNIRAYSTTGTRPLGVPQSYCRGAKLLFDKIFERYYLKNQSICKKNNMNLHNINSLPMKHQKSLLHSDTNMHV